MVRLVTKGTNMQSLRTFRRLGSADKGGLTATFHVVRPTHIEALFGHSVHALQRFWLALLSSLGRLELFLWGYFGFRCP